MRSTNGVVLIAGLLVSGIAANAGTVYVDDSAGNLYAGDPATGVFALIGNDAVGTAMADIDFTSNGTLYGMGNDSILYTINPATGVAAPVGPNAIGFVAGMAGDAFGNLYAGGTGNIYTINTATGAGAPVGAGGNPYNVSGDLEFVNSTLYLTSADTGSGGALWTVSTANAVGAFVGETGFNAVWGMAYDTDNGVFYGYTSGGQEFTINPANLALDAAVNTNLPALLGSEQLLGAAFISGVPEPSTLATFLFGSGLVVAAIVRRRKANA